MPNNKIPYARKLGYALGGTLATCLAVLLAVSAVAITAKIITWLLLLLF